MLINNHVMRIQKDDAKFERYRRGQAARRIMGELIRNMAKDHMRFTIGTYVLYKEHDLDIVEKLLRYNDIEARVKVVDVVGKLPDCVNEVHGIGFAVDRHKPKLKNALQRLSN